MSTDFFPPSSVGVLKEDAPNLVMVNLGIDPKTSQQPRVGPGGGVADEAA